MNVTADRTKAAVRPSQPMGFAGRLAAITEAITATATPLSALSTSAGSQLVSLAGTRCRSRQAITRPEVTSATDQAARPPASHGAFETGIGHPCHRARPRAVRWHAGTGRHA